MAENINQWHIFSMFLSIFCCFTPKGDVKQLPLCLSSFMPHLFVHGALHWWCKLLHRTPGAQRLLLCEWEDRSRLHGAALMSTPIGCSLYNASPPMSSPQGKSWHTNRSHTRTQASIQAPCDVMRSTGEVMVRWGESSMVISLCFA